MSLRRLSRKQAKSLLDRVERLKIAKSAGRWTLNDRGSELQWDEKDAPGVGEFIRSLRFHLSSSRHAIQSELGRIKGSSDGGVKGAKTRRKDNAGQTRLEETLKAYIRRNPKIRPDKDTVDSWEGGIIKSNGKRYSRKHILRVYNDLAEDHSWRT